jgi:hypothetical protein
MPPARAPVCRAIRRWRSIATPTTVFWASVASRFPARLERYERLKDQAEAIEGRGPFERIWLVLREPDLRVSKARASASSQPFPLTIAGGVMALWALHRLATWRAGSAGTVKASAKMLRGRKAGPPQKVRAFLMNTESLETL